MSGLEITGLEIIVLGCTGGPSQNNLSSYLLGKKGESQLLALDAGTLFHGLAVAQSLGQFAGEDVVTLLQNRIKGYLISHSHLDHIAGLIVASQMDTKKPLFGLTPTLEAIRDHIFN